LNDRVYNNGIDRLRSPERVARLEVERVVDLCLQNENIKSLLDIGTGSGLFAEAFHNKNIKVAGVDLNPEMIEAAKRYLPNCVFKVSLAEEIPFEDQSFDMIFFGVVFHEVNDFKKVLEEAKRVTINSVSILEWGYKTEEFGPPLEHRLSEEFIRELSEGIGFTRFEVILLKNLVLYKLYK
jgi:ubiquinone/menaquinone biosynthesis C-methylase UbiE